MFVWGELQNKTLPSRIVSLNLNWLLIVCIQFGKLGYLQFALTACLVAGVWGRGAGVTVISLSSVRRLAAGAGAKYSVSCATFYDAALSNNFLRESGESPVRQRLIFDHWQFLHLQSYITLTISQTKFGQSRNFLRACFLFLLDNESSGIFVSYKNVVCIVKTIPI